MFDLSELSNLTYKDLQSIEYEFIFDYYDLPLSFIAFVNNENYLFYYMDDNSYFVSKLAKKDVESLSEHKDLTIFFHQLVNDNRIELIAFNHEDESIVLTNVLNREMRDCFPTISNKIECDFYRAIEITENYRFEDGLVFNK